MEHLTSWIQQIILIILFAIVVEMLLPTSEWKRYAKIVIGLILFLTIVQPVLSVFNVDAHKLLTIVSNENKTEELKLDEEINVKINDIKRVQDESVSKQVAGVLKEQVADELASRYNLFINDLEVSFIEEEINLTVIVDELVEDEVKTSESLKPVSINVELENEKAIEENFKQKKREDVLALLAESWGLQKNEITLIIN